MTATIAVPVDVPLPQSRVATDAGPVRDRIVVLDVLRGIALLGMYLVHFGYKPDRSANAGWFETAWWAINDYGLSSKFYTMFGILFGVGFAVQMARAERSGKPFVLRYLRRIAVLAVIGLLLEGIFDFAVLVSYAIWSIPLLLVRKWSTPVLTVLLVLCANYATLSMVSKLAIAGGGKEQLRAIAAEKRASFTRFRAEQAKLTQAEEATDWGTVVAARFRFIPHYHRQWGLTPDSSFTLFLLGLLALRLGIFDQAAKHRGLIVGLMLGGMLSWFMATWGFRLLMPPGTTSHLLPANRVLALLVDPALRGFGLVWSEWLAFAIMGAVLLLSAAGVDRLRALAVFRWPGCMALTNYVMQAAIIDIVFTKHGFGVPVTALTVPVYALALFLGQSALSRWWLQRYRFGPLEWCWRSITYWQRQPMRIVSTTHQPALAPA